MGWGRGPKKFPELDALLDAGWRLELSRHADHSRGATRPGGTVTTFVVRRGAERKAATRNTLDEAFATVVQRINGKAAGPS